MRLLYFGSGEFGLPTLQMLSERHEVAAVITQPDRPAGRKRKLTPTPITQWAAEQNLSIIKADDANAADVVARIAELRADAAVVIAFGQKLSPALIGAAGELVVNLHASLLPKYRGAAPINWAVIHGEADTGLSVIGLAQRMDAGLIFGQLRTPIDPLETAGELHDRLAAMGPPLVARVLADHKAGALEGLSQDDAAATRAPKLKKTDGVVDFAAPAAALRCRIHGLTPWPGVTVTWRHDDAEQPLILRRVRDVNDETRNAKTQANPGVIVDPTAGLVATGAGCIQLLEVQTPGKRVMSFTDFTRGHPMNTGDVLS